MGNDLPFQPVDWGCGDETRSLQSDEAQPETSIGPYQLVRQLGEGGMGVVYQARQYHPLRRDVALKVIKPGMDSKQVILRFENERQTLAMMDHPNIAHVFDAGSTDQGLPYFVMELVDGIPITRYCDSKRLTVIERIELFIPVCQAIQHAHQKGIIHRDIKPSNILVGQHESRAVPKVIDFGLAKALGGYISDATMMTNAGAVVGTLDYMSPEQAEIGRQDIDTRSDVYSLGAVLYELLTGTTPLGHERLAKASYPDALQRIREEEPKPPSIRLRQSEELKEAAFLRQSDPSTLPRLLHHELDWIAMKALDKDRTRRYETVNGLARDLRRHLECEPVEAAPPAAAYRVSKFIRKYQLWLGAAAAFTVVLVGGVVVSTWLAVRAGRAESVARAFAQEAQTVNDFLRNDVLSQASTIRQVDPAAKPDPDLKVRTALDRAAGRIEGKFKSAPLVEASIRQTIGNTYTDLGLYSEAQQHLERSLELRRRVLGDDDPSTLQSMSDVGRVLERRGKFSQAETFYGTALKAQLRTLGEEHQSTLSTRAGLAAVYFGQGKLSEAETALSILLESQRRAFGQEDPQTLQSMGNLAAVYHAQGKYEEAEPLYKRTLAMYLQGPGEEYAMTQTVMANLGEMYSTQGRYGEAEQLLGRALQIQLRQVGEGHRRTISCMKYLAAAYFDQAMYAQAESLFGRARTAGLKSLGADHPLTLECLHGLAETHLKQSRLQQAGELHAKVLDVRCRILGPDHPDTLESLISLCETRLRQRKFAESETQARKALHYFETMKLDRFSRYRCQSLLGASLSGQRRFAEAEQFLISGYEGMVQRPAVTAARRSSTLGDTGQRIVSFYREWDKPEKVEVWKRKLEAAQPAPTTFKP